ncbi:MAG TPA: hypothetical protein VHH12_16305 [Mycobacterium sp.]|nr:hypothetical protein [Mycobacterium sp.]
MRTALAHFRTAYGSHPLHLMTLVAGFALFGYVIATIGPAALWNDRTWWQSILVWFAVAIIAHDLVLFPVYALMDRILLVSNRFRSRVSVVNHVRIPALASGLTLLVFLPGIIEQGAGTFYAATGMTQDPFLQRWLLFTAAMFGLSAVVYAVRLAMTRLPIGWMRVRARPASSASSAAQSMPTDAH